jgi:peptidoglycan/LPS O-acetylase OafA/YrhL
MQLPVFFGGIALFHLIGNAEGRKKWTPWRFWFLALSAMGYVALAYSPYAQEPIAFGVILIGFIVYLACARQSILVNSWIRWLGKISFSCYICHFFVLHELGKRLQGWNFANLEPSLGYMFNCGWLLAVSLLVSSSFAMISYSLIEKPGIRLGNKLVEKLEQNALQAKGLN